MGMGGDVAQGAGSGGAAGGPWGAVAGGVGAGVLDYLGAQQTNEANQQEAQKNRDFQRIEASVAYNRQLDARKTAYQDTVSDLKKAGLNPMLAYMNGSNGLSSAAQAGSVANPTMENALGSGVSTAFKAADTIQSMRAADADIALKGAQATTNLATAQRETANAANLQKQSRLLDATYESSRAEADYKEGSSKLNKKLLETQKILDLIQQGVGTTTDAMGGAPTKMLKELFKKKYKIGLP
jgi:hypothetical protein